ncbi:MAG: glycosyltransferase family 87 protein [Rhodomicrobium sp.]
MSKLRAIPSYMIAAAALFASMVPGALALFAELHWSVVHLTLAQGAIYAAFAWLLLRNGHRFSAKQSHRAFAVLLGFGVLMRAMLLFAPPHSTDIYRYVWDGRVQAAGINPYAYVPADPALAHLRDTVIYPNVNRKDYAPTIYPPAAQAVYFFATRLSETVPMMKAAMLAFEALAIWALVQLLAARGLPIVFASLYFLHPLPVWEIAGSGHVDSVAVAFIWLAFLASEKGARFASGAALAAGVLTKYFPLALTPALYRRWDWKMPASFAVTAAALYLPYLLAGKKVLGFLGGYAGEELGAGDGLYIAAVFKQLGFGAAALPVFLALAVLTLSALAWRTGFRANPDKPDLQGAFAIAIAFTVFFSPHFAWYFIWLIPFLCFFPRPSVFWLTLSATALYRSGWPPSLAGASIQYLPFAILLILENLKPVTVREAPDGRAAA